ncbi:MAG: mannose-6-phosphate isomerase [Ruminococcaceae bacterium]|nr:mannose-6-phosphate isomerase [Oscillospiraceae bacterium]
MLLYFYCRRVKIDKGEKAMELYPFLLSNVTKSPIWGGTRLKEGWGKRIDSPTVGESWELTVRKNEKSLILNGAYAGRTLESVIAEAGVNFIAPDYTDEAFPLLVKLIDACDRLSVQVHPNDDYAARVENDRGKTEMWYIVEAEEGAEIICGLRDGATAEDFARSVREGDYERELKRCAVRPGETYFIPAGLPHAIGKGVLIAEIQQNCDLTYRVYDYGRRQPDGSLRELHVEKALEVVRPFTEEEIDEIRFARRSDTLAGGEVLADCQYFRVERLCVREKHILPSCSEMRHILCLSGEGVIRCNGEEYPISKGSSYLLPPLPAMRVEGNLMALVSGV